MKMANDCFSRLFLCLWSAIFFFSCVLAAWWVHAQEPGEQPRAGGGPEKQDVLVIETDLGQEKVEIEKGEIPLLAPPPAIFPKDNAGAVDLETVLEKMELEKQQVIQLNRSLRKVIEENESLMRQNRDLDNQLRNLKGQRTIEYNRMQSAMKERDEYKDQLEDLSGLKEQFEQDVLTFKQRQLMQEQQLQEKVRSLQDELAQAQQNQEEIMRQRVAPLVGKGTASLSYMESLKAKTSGARLGESAGPIAASLPGTLTEDGAVVLEALERIREEKERMKEDQAKIHYSMGNKYFRLGKYGEAMGEFKKTIDLSPGNANAHFNLAFVSGNYLNDFKTALAHYRQYILLNPHAEDAALVKEKIVEAELFLRSEIPSGLEKDLVNQRNMKFVR